MTRIIGLVRFVAIFGIVASILLSAGLFVATVVRAVSLLIATFGDIANETAFHALLIGSIEVADALLVATGLLIVSIGLFSLFIKRLEKLPNWLHIDSFEALKDKLASVIVSALIVRFFSVASGSDESANVLLYGAAIAAVLAGLAIYSLANAWAERLRVVEHSSTTNEKAAQT